MRMERSTLLAGFAALALLAGTGLAAGQEAGKAKTAQATQPNAATQQMHKGKAAGKMSQNAQLHKRHAASNKTATSKTGKTRTAQMARRKHMAMKGRTTRMAQRKHVAMKGRTTRMSQRRHVAMKGRTTRMSQRQYAATGVQRHYAAKPQRAVTGTAMARRNYAVTARREHRRLAGLQANAAPRAARYRGLQGNAAPRTLRFSEQQRTQIHNMVMGAPWAHNVTFGVTVGAVVPHSSVNLVRVTPTLMNIDHAWRGMDYFVWQNQLVIVNPRTMRIIAIVPA